MVYGILVPGPGIEPISSSLEARSLNHWTTKEAPVVFIVVHYRNTHSWKAASVISPLLHPPMSTKVHLVKAMVFPVVMYGCESWTVKKAERRRIDAFELWCWRRLLRVPWIARRSNQSILKEISPGCSLEGLMLKLKLQYFGHLM